MVVLVRLKFSQIKVDVDYVCIRYIFYYIISKCLQQLSLSASSYACNNLDIGSTHYLNDFLQVIISLYQPHRSSPLSYDTPSITQNQANFIFG